MKVAELIERLQDLDPEMDVHIGYDYGGHYHRTVTPEVKEVEEMTIAPSPYYRDHSMDYVVEDSSPKDGRKGARIVVVLL